MNCACQTHKCVGHVGLNIAEDLDHLSHSPKAARILANKALDGAAKIEGGHQLRALRAQNVAKGRSG